MKTIRVRNHWRRGMPVKGYVRRHNYLATVKGSPEFKREVEKNKDLFEGRLPVNVREGKYIEKDTLGYFTIPSLKWSAGINVDVSTSVPDWKSTLVHEGYHVRERQRGRRESLEEERANLEAIRRVPSEAKYKTLTGSRSYYPRNIFRKPSQFAKRMAAFEKPHEAWLSPTIADLERLHTRKRKR